MRTAGSRSTWPTTTCSRCGATATTRSPRASPARRVASSRTSTTTRTVCGPRCVARRRLVRGGAERDGDGRGRGAAAGHHRRARAAGRRALQRHEVVVERVVRARVELAQRHRLPVLLLDRHRRPARQVHGRRAPRVLAGRVPPDPAVRRRALRRHQPAAVVPGRGDQAAVPQRARGATRRGAAGPRRDRDRPAAHRDRAARHHPPGGEAGRGPHAARGHGAADHRRRAVRPRLRRRARFAPRGAPRRGRAVHARLRRAPRRRRRRRGRRRGPTVRRAGPAVPPSPGPVRTWLPTRCRPRCSSARSTPSAGATDAPATR